MADIDLTSPVGDSGEIAGDGGGAPLDPTPESGGGDTSGSPAPGGKQNWLKNLKKAPWYVWLGIAIAGGTLVIAFIQYKRSSANGSPGSTQNTSAPGGVTYGYGTHYDTSNGGYYDTASHDFSQSGQYDSQPPQVDYNALLLAMFNQAFNRAGNSTTTTTDTGSGNVVLPPSANGIPSANGGYHGGPTGIPSSIGGTGGYSGGPTGIPGSRGGGATGFNQPPPVQGGGSIPLPGPRAGRWVGRPQGAQ